MYKFPTHYENFSSIFQNAFLPKVITCVTLVLQIFHPAEKRSMSSFPTDVLAVEAHLDNLVELVHPNQPCELGYRCVTSYVTV
jgi:hypothetical protein